ALNTPTRCALSTLRGGGNRSGADAVLTWQTGFPFAVDFARGYPSYHPQTGGAAVLGRGEVDVALVVGAPASLPAPVAPGLARGPRHGRDARWRGHPRACRRVERESCPAVAP